MEDRVVGVIGAGVMGQGVAQSLAGAGKQVILLDVSDELLERAREQITKGVRMQILLGRKKDGPSPEEVIERIRFSTDYQLLSSATFVVENVTEKWSIKERVWPQLDAICPAGCVFAANTSAIPITRIGALTRRPDHVLGMHFMNPVPMKPTVEVIRAYHTSEHALERARALLTSMGKEAIVVNDSPGFVSNRVLMLTINEAIFLVHEQVASPEDVDRIFTTCFGHKMGPLATADLIGLDTILLSLEVLYESFRDPKFRPCPLLQKMVDAGLHGRKNGKGFFQYPMG